MSPRGCAASWAPLLPVWSPGKRGILSPPSVSLACRLFKGEMLDEEDPRIQQPDVCPQSAGIGLQRSCSAAFRSVTNMAAHIVSWVDSEHWYRAVLSEVLLVWHRILFFIQYSWTTERLTTERLTTEWLTTERLRLMRLND